MLTFALFGAGRIGRLHAANIAGHPAARLGYVYDLNAGAAQEVAGAHGAKPVDDPAATLADPAVGAILIASPTATHVDLILAGARAGKAVLCEKPIDLDSARVEVCRAQLAGLDAPIQIGFNRRFDPTHRAVRQAIAAGEIGTVEQVVISSRDPAPPPVDYLKGSGGLFRDMMIHDFDLARFLTGEEIVEVTALGSVLVDPAIAEVGDVDSAMVVMRTEGGRLVHINNSRRCAYGYDQRVEAFGSAGMVRSGNRRATEVERFGARATAAQDPLLHFFIERYAEAYVNELDDFIAAVTAGRPPSVGFEDGRRALLLADAAVESLKTGRTVRPKY